MNPTHIRILKVTVHFKSLESVPILVKTREGTVVSGLPLFFPRLTGETSLDT